MITGLEAISTTGVGLPHFSVFLGGEGQRCFIERTKQIPPPPSSSPSLLADSPFPPMTLCSELADFEWLTGDEAGGLLADLAESKDELHTTIARLRARLSQTRAHLLVEQVELRRRAAAKFTQAARMFFTRTGLEQATDEWIAAYKASRFTTQRPASSSTPGVFADLCCGIGGDLASLTKQASTIGIDRDPVSTLFAAANTGATIHTIDVADFDLTSPSSVNAWHIDPDRRATGRRTTSIDWFQPDLATIETLLARAPHAAIKLAPATRPPTDWLQRCELEWISRDGECKQLVAWHGNLALSPHQHRATILASTPAARGLAPRSLTGSPNQSITITGTPDRYVFDMDPAVSAARLTGALAVEHNLSALAAGPTYLTGPRAITTDSALRCFEVEELLPVRVRTLAPALRERNIGQLEIKKRGVDVDPEALRRGLKLRGTNAATLLITPIAGRPTAILAERIRP